VISVRDLSWAAGFLDGDGSFVSNYTSPTVSAVQGDPELLLRLQSLFGGRIGQRGRKVQPKHYQAAFTWVLGGAPAAGVMMTLYPLLSQHRRWQIVFALRKWLDAPGPNVLRRYCRRGHPLAGVNLRLHRGRKGNPARECRICRNVHRRAASPARYRWRRAKRQATGAISYPCPSARTHVAARARQIRALISNQPFRRAHGH
jgi:hypothetical protein